MNNLERKNRVFQIDIKSRMLVVQLLLLESVIQILMIIQSEPKSQTLDP